MTWRTDVSTEVCIHDPREQLPASQCVLCNGRVARERAAEARAKGSERVGPLFPAVYRGECSECDGVIEEGDIIRMVGGKPVCADCHPDPKSSWSAT